MHMMDSGSTAPSWEFIVATSIGSVIVVLLMMLIVILTINLIIKRYYAGLICEYL